MVRHALLAGLALALLPGCAILWVVSDGGSDEQPPDLPAGCEYLPQSDAGYPADAGGWHCNPALDLVPATCSADVDLSSVPCDCPKHANCCCPAY